MINKKQRTKVQLDIRSNKNSVHLLEDEDESLYLYRQEEIRYQHLFNYLTISSVKQNMLTYNGLFRMCDKYPMTVHGSGEYI